MQKTPVYLGIFLEDSKNGAKDIRGYSKQCLEMVKDKHEDISVQKDLEILDQIYIFPKDNHHITTLFIGGDQKKLSHKKRQNYQKFQYGKKMPIKIDCFVYVPNCIMVGYCSNTEGVQVDNKYPHVTLMLTTQTKAVESNDVLELVFGKYPDLLKDEFETRALDIKYKHSEKIYVVRREHMLKCVTGDNFKNGRR